MSDGEPVTRRLVYSYLAITALVLAVLVVPLGVSNQRRQLREVQAGLERDAFVLASLVEDGLAQGQVDPAAGAEVQSYADRVGARVVIVDASGNSLLDTDPTEGGDPQFASRPEVATALDGRVATGTRHSDTLGTDLVYAAVPGGRVRHRERRGAHHLPEHGGGRPGPSLLARPRRPWRWCRSWPSPASGCCWPDR